MKELLQDALVRERGFDKIEDLRGKLEVSTKTILYLQLLFRFEE